MNRVALALALLAAPAVAAPAAPDLSKRPTLAPPPNWKAPAATSATTPGGVRVAVLSEHSLPLVTVLVAVQAGADLDPPGQPGLAAAVATMLQDGGAGLRTAPEVADALADLGAELQVQCDLAGVQLQLTVLARDLDRALALVADMVARPRFDDSEWKRVRERRVAEILRARDEPRKIADQVFDRVLFGDHPYGHPQLGTPSSVEAMSLEQIKSFFGTHYGPRTTSVLLLGDVPPETAVGRVEAAFKSWKGSAQVPSAPPAPKPAAGGSRIFLVDRPGAPQSEVRVGYLGLSRGTPDFPSMAVLEMVLGGSFTSRLVQNLREKHGYTYGVRDHFQLLRAPGPFVVQTAVRSDATAPALGEIFAELAGIRKPLPASDVDKGRSLVEGMIVEQWAQGATAARLVGDLLLFDLPLDFWSNLPAKLKALSASQVSQVAQKIFHPDSFTIVVVGDAKAIEPGLQGLKIPIVRVDVDGNPIK